MGAVLSRPAGVLDLDLVNSRAWRTGSFPAINLHATASALAGFYAHVLDEDGPVARRLGPDLHREYATLQVSGPDLVLGFDVGWTLGFQRDSIEIGMGGVGGSVGLAELRPGSVLRVRHPRPEGSRPGRRHLRRAGSAVLADLLTKFVSHH